MCEMRTEDLLTKIHDPYPIPLSSTAVRCETKPNQVEQNLSGILMPKAEIERTESQS
jgi:hypothetical protein